jgi:5-formyltetrahydrofolate cyclo-ligase
MPLIFRAYSPGDRLVLGARNIDEPATGAEELTPDIVLVPLLAFNRSRARLGYGGGYYDRTLHNLRKNKKILGLGIAFSGQEVIEIPTNPFDAPLDKIITEDAVF